MPLRECVITRLGSVVGFIQWCYNITLFIFHMILRLVVDTTLATIFTIGRTEHDDLQSRSHYAELSALWKQPTELNIMLFAISVQTWQDNPYLISNIGVSTSWLGPGRFSVVDSFHWQLERPGYQQPPPDLSTFVFGDTKVISTLVLGDILQAFLRACR